MRFLARAFTGLVLLAVCVALLALGANRLIQAREAGKSGGGRPPSERSYAVELRTLAPATVAPQIRAYGEILSWRSLELRAPLAGAIISIDDSVRDGETVLAGAELLVIDPGDASSRVAEARVSLSQARIDQSEAKAAVELVEAEISAARRQLELRRNELARQQQLFAKGVVSRASVESAELAVATATQTLAGREQQLLSAKMRVDNTALGVERARIGVDERDTDLSETRVIAPFSGRLAEVSASAGRRVSPNEKLARLIDPQALEVRFTLRDALFGRLVDANGEIQPLPVQVTLSLGPRVEVLEGFLDRDAATVATDAGGRTVYARLDVPDVSLIRPGDFVDVTVFEPALQNVAELPASAITRDGEVFLVNDESRLEVMRLDVFRKLDESVVVRDAPWGREFVVNRLPQLGNGVKVRQRGDESNKSSGEDSITLDPARRQRLIEFVESNKRMPEARRNNILKRLAEPSVPRSMVERIESRMKG